VMAREHDPRLDGLMSAARTAGQAAGCFT